jgi:RNA polymerase sigma-70 factor (ECF subfamily)
MAPERPSFDSVLENAAFARRLARALVGDDARADDVVQQAWVAALEHPPRAGRGIRAWLATVVRNAAAKLRREESRRRAREQSAAARERQPAAVDVAAKIAAQRELLDAVARLDEPYRTVLHQRYFEERTPMEIARALGAPVRTIETRLRRGLEQLRADLDRRFAGGRKAWAGLLLPASVNFGAPAAAGLATGGIVMSIQTKVALGVAGVAIAAAGWSVLHDERNLPDAAREAAAITPTASSASEDPLAIAATSDPASTDRAMPVLVERTDERCLVTVLTPEGRGLPGAVLVLFRDDEEHEGTLLGDAVTDEDGEAALPKVSDASELLVHPGCAPPRRLPVAPRTTSLDVVLEEGEVFSGWITVDGRRPETPVELTLASTSELYPAIRLPDAVGLRVSALAGSTAWYLRCTTDRAGNFLFYGLQSKTRFAVSLPVPFEDAGTGAERTYVDEAREHVELALRTNPSFRGRVVDLHGAPLAGWRQPTSGDHGLRRPFPLMAPQQIRNTATLAITAQH